MTIKRKTVAGRPDNQRSLAELKSINANVLNNHQQLNQIIDTRQKELATMRDSLYVEVQNFREAHQAELRRSAEAAFQLASQSLPWWKRTVKNLAARAQEITNEITVLVKAEAARVKAEVDAANEEDRKEKEALKLRMEADQAALKAAAEKDAALADANAKLDQADAKMKMTDDGYGGLKADPVEDTYEVDTELVGTQAEPVDMNTELTPVNQDA